MTGSSRSDRRSRGALAAAAASALALAAAMQATPVDARVVAATK